MKVQTVQLLVDSLDFIAFFFVFVLHPEPILGS